MKWFAKTDKAIDLKSGKVVTVVEGKPLEHVVVRDQQGKKYTRFAMNLEKIEPEE